MAPYRDYARRLAERWDLRFEEIPGLNALVRKMLFGPWDDDFVVVPPGEAIRYEHFFPEEMRDMKIIGEKINGTRKAVKEAVLTAMSNSSTSSRAAQAEAGSTWIDVNAGTPTDREPDDLVWLVETVQAA